MRYFFPALLLAPPALAHPVNLTHTHAADWPLPIAVLLMLSALVITLRRVARSSS